jgi:hypothetical protein
MLLKDLLKTFNKSVRDRLGLLFGFVYSLYNILVGIIVGTIWHIAIGIYYLLLLSVKIILMIVQKRGKMSTMVFILTSLLLFLISLSLVVPIITMITNQRPVSIPLEVAIGIATYTTYKVTVAIIGFVKNWRTDNMLRSELVTIGLIEAIVSVLTLQNTLITVNGGAGDSGLTILSTISSAVGLCGILYLVLRLIVKYFKEKNSKTYDEPSLT